MVFVRRKIWASHESEYTTKRAHDVWLKHILFQSYNDYTNRHDIYTKDRIRTEAYAYLVLLLIHIYEFYYIQNKEI